MYTLELFHFFFYRNRNLLKEQKRRVLEPLSINVIYGDHEVCNSGLLFTYSKNVNQI